MIISKEQYEKINPIVERMNKIVACSEADWEEKYNAIFSEEISRVFFDTFPDFDYFDPDADYYDDVCAFVSAVKEFWSNVKVI